jgi:pimeloyl-ACP methyl ester carboxylesterase
MQKQRLTAERDDIEIAVERFTSAGEPLLLIHGIDAEMFYWHDGFCGALADRGFEVARFDNRDSGESTHLHAAGTLQPRRARRNPEVAPYRVDDMAEDVVAVLDALDWRAAHVVGHSFGGVIGQVLSVRHPDRVLSLTAISSSVSASVGGIRPATILRLMRANPADFLGRPPSGPKEAAERLVRGHRVVGSPGYPLDVAWLTDIAKVRHERGYDPAARARQVAAGWAAGDLRPQLVNVRVPTLVLHGRHDVVVRPEGGRAIADAITGAKLVMLDGMGHDLPRDLWPTFVEEIRSNADSRNAQE